MMLCALNLKTSSIIFVVSFISSTATANKLERQRLETSLQATAFSMNHLASFPPPRIQASSESSLWHTQSVMLDALENRISTLLHPHLSYLRRQMASNSSNNGTQTLIDGGSLKEYNAMEFWEGRCASALDMDNQFASCRCCTSCDLNTSLVFLACRFYG